MVSKTKTSLNTTPNPREHCVLTEDKSRAVKDVKRLPRLNQIYNQMCLTKGIIPTIDAFGKSIGRRYARADEIGIPWAITIDHQSTIDNTVTVRKRDNQQQIRMDIQDLISRLAIGNLADSNKWNN